MGFTIEGGTDDLAQCSIEIDIYPINTKEIKSMSNDELVLNRFVVNKVWEIAQTCLDENKKGWFVNMAEFRDAMDSLDFTANEVRAALSYLEARSVVITFLDADGGVARISCVPQRYRCRFCNMWVNTQDDPEGHIDHCLKQQKKIERNKELLR
jgi:hypothetical protein